MRKLAENWLGFAYADLRAAQKLVDDGELTGVATFHSQQCVEKSLKAMLALHGRKIPRIHDLVTLHSRVSDVLSSSVEAASQSCSPTGLTR